MLRHTVYVVVFIPLMLTILQVSSIQLCPDLSSYDFGDHLVELGLSGVHQCINATLALQLCKTWMEEKRQEVDFQCRYSFLFL